MTAASIFWLVVIAASGGVFVFIGLLMERFSEKHWHKSVSDFRRCKSRNVWGEWVVIFGIVIEIAVGIVSAIDAWQTRQMAIKNSPLNRPISQISAILRFEINQEKIRDLPHFGGPAMAYIFLEEPVDAIGGNGKPIVMSPLDINGGTGKLNALYELGSTNTLPTLVADNFSTPDFFIGPGPFHRPYFMQFHMWDFAAGSSTEWERRKAKEIDRVQALYIDVKFLPHDVEILSGSVDVIVNATLRKTFKISPQKDNLENPLDTFSNTTGFVILATNSSPLAEP